jgi:hypothetical protein
MDMKCGSPYMTWPNDRLTRGSVDDISVVQNLMWKGDWVVQMLTLQGD